MGVAFSYDATQSGNTFSDADNDTLTYSATFSPDANGLSANNGKISGTPTDAETTTVTITANDGNGGTVSDTFTITTSAASNSAPTVASANADQTATVGVAFTQGGATFTDANNDTLTYTVSFSPDANGLSASNGQISGTPTDAETTTITANDGNGGTVNDVFTIASSAAPTTGNVTISGRVTFDFVPHATTPPFGLDYNNTVARPARGVTVQALSQTNSVLATGETDANGDYSFDVAAGTSVRVRVRAEMAGFGSGRQVRVIDNTNSGAEYVLDGSLASSGNSNSVRNLHAASGWGGSSYTGTRAAAPFVMLDNIYDSMQLVLSVDPNATFAEVNVNWSVNNRPAQGQTSNGDISTSFFRQTTTNNVVTNDLFILGAADNDSDEYDRHVIVHEWGHYFEANFSRSDSVGGPHTDGDWLDMRLAFGEGWGTAIASMVLNDPAYRDTSGAQQGQASAFDVEDNTVNNPGWYSEASMWAILYDLYDSNNESSVDTVTLGFGPIYEIMTDEQRTTPLFTSVFTFITALKADNPGQAAGIDALVGHHNIVANTIDAEGSTETNNAGNNNVLPIYTQLSVGGSATNLCLSDVFGPINKLTNIRYLNFTIASAGSYRIDVTRSPTGSNPGDPDFYLFSGGTIRASAEVAATNNQETLTTNLEAADYVMELRDFQFTGDRNPRDSEACYNVTLTAQ